MGEKPVGAAKCKYCGKLGTGHLLVVGDKPGKVEWCCCSDCMIKVFDKTLKE